MRLNMPQVLKLTRRSFMAGAGALGALAATGARPLEAAEFSLEKAMERKFVGDENAPLNMLEFFSLGCPHCRNFHADVLPTIKKEFVDTGKVRIELRDYPLGVKATAASMITRCAPPERYHGLVELMFRSQAKWAQVNDSLPPLKQVAKFGGLSGEDVEACLNNVELLEAIRTRAEADSAEYGIEATPTFIIGENRRKIEGSGSVEIFRAALNEELS